jgi:phosphorylcholine metabolism protein LicD
VAKVDLKHFRRTVKTDWAKEAEQMKEISMDFFRDEVRNGFFIPTAVKQAWAAQLQVLDVIDTICRKHGITYFADWGTILGTVRHGGYVPWDDDMDICMKREDYTRFKEAAKTELPESFCIHDYEHQEDHWLFLSRVVNNKHICFEPEHMKQFHNFPYLAGIDIFVLDYLYKDEQQEKQRCEEVKHIIAVADGIIAGEIAQPVKEANLIQLEQKYHKTFNRKLDNRHMGIELYRLAEEQMARVPKEESDRMAQIFPWGLLGNRGQDREYYEKFVRLPFENTTMPVPADYHRILSGKYHDYFKIHKVWSGHDYPYFEGQRKNLQAVADFKLPEFTFDKAMLRQNTKEMKNSDTMQNIAAEALLNIEKLHNAFLAEISRKTAGAEQADSVAQLLDMLAQCQSVAIDLGNFIEQMKGEENLSAKACVAALEEYCEKIFDVYNNLPLAVGREKEDFQKLCAALNQAFVQMKQMVESEIIYKKLVAFLPDNPKRWKEMQALYDYYTQQENTEACVIPLPLFTKNLYGEIVAGQDEYDRNDKRNEYPAYLNVIPWHTVQMQSYEFAAIVIQNPYDAENPYLTVPPVYYAKQLQQYTDCLIYMMPQGVNDFTENDITDVYGLKYSLMMPGAMYADRILIESPAMKALFVNHLTAFAGEDTKEVWADKVMTISAFSGESAQTGQPVQNGQCGQTPPKKKLLYCIGENEFYENAEMAINKVKERLNVMTQYPESLKVAVCLYPYDIAAWDICTGQEKDMLVQVLKEYRKNKGIELLTKNVFDINGIDDMTAYYGSPSPLICRFVQQHKPAMVSEEQ